MNTHDHLLAILNAQWRSKYHEFAGADIITLDGASVHFTYNFGGKNAHVLEVLLSPQGLKAAYPTKMNMGGRPVKHDKQARYVAQAIFTTWLSSNGDAATTIETAFSLLPDSN